MTSDADITTSRPSQDDPPRQHYGLTFAVLALASSTFAILQSLVAPALPEIQRELHASATAVAWVLTAYLLSASVLTPIVGRLGDMFGKEHTLVFALGILGAAPCSRRWRRTSPC
jgi:MFS family permease